MKFTTAAAVEQLVWEMRLADYPRALNRAQMNALANGAPPYTDQEQRQNQINTKVNFLDYTELLVDARRQLEGRFSWDRLFTVNLDFGPVWKRREYSETITSKINRIMRRSRSYVTGRNGAFANTALHGVGPHM
jgi:hypothetical protein